MNSSELKDRNRKRILIDSTVEKIKEIDEKISHYDDNMDEKSFENSNEVESLYDELRKLGLDLWSECK